MRSMLAGSCASISARTRSRRVSRVAVIVIGPPPARGQHLCEQLRDAAASQRLRVGRQLEVDAGGAREQQLGHEAGWARRSLAGRGVDVGEAVGDLDERALVRVDVALVQLGIARCVHPELGDEQPPALLRLRQLDPGPHHDGDGVGAGLAHRDAPVLLGPLGDALVEQREEEVGLARELRVDDALGEAGGLGDLVDRCGVIAAFEEHVPGGGEDQVAVALDLLGSPQPRCHTIRIQIRTVCGVNP